MSRKIAQVRYYGVNSALNSSGVTGATLRSGSAFNDFTPMVQLRVTAPEGSKFYINKGLYPIIIGASQEYFIELNDVMTINHLSFDVDTIRNINNSINEEETKSIIVDIIYND